MYLSAASRTRSKTMAQRKEAAQYNKENRNPVITEVQTPKNKIPKKQIKENPEALAGALDTMNSHRLKRSTRRRKY